MDFSINIKTSLKISQLKLKYEATGSEKLIFEWSFYWAVRHFKHIKPLERVVIKLFDAQLKQCCEAFQLPSTSFTIKVLVVGAVRLLAFYCLSVEGLRSSVVVS